jgi:hypothetical protein
MVTAITPMSLEASPGTLTSLGSDGSALRMDTSAMGMDSQVAVAVQSLLESQQTQDAPGMTIRLQLDEM